MQILQKHLGFFSDYADPLTNSEEDSSGEVEVEKSRINRVERVYDFNEIKRKEKRDSDIEVDSEGNPVLPSPHY